ncbi:MAG: CvpA family protein [Campylobacterales bacterium]|nr:CvpA family protein [Campylobacterales bacterium]
MDYHILDIIVIALVTVLGLKGLFHGMVKEVFGLLGLVGGVFIASRIAGDMGALVSSFLPFVENDSGGKLAGFAAAFLIFWALMILTGGITTKLVQKSGLGLIDKLAGAVVGAAKIFLIFAIVAYAMGSIGFIKKRVDIIFEGSSVYPLLFDTGSFIMKFDEVKAVADIKEIGNDASKQIEEKVTETIKKSIESNTQTKEEIEKAIQQKIDEAVKDLDQKGEL